MRWSSASRARRAAALDKVGTTIRFVLLDLQDVMRMNADLAAEYIRCNTDEQREQLAFEWFGDLGNPQPTERAIWPLWGRTPDWPGGQLPPLDDADVIGPANDETVEKRSRPRHREAQELPAAAVLDCVELVKRRLAAGRPRRGQLTQEAIAISVGLDRHRVQQIEQLLDDGWDLPRSRGDFSANGVVRLPRAKKRLQ